MTAKSFAQPKSAPVRAAPKSGKSLVPARQAPASGGILSAAAHLYRDFRQVPVGQRQGFGDDLALEAGRGPASNLMASGLTACQSARAAPPSAPPAAPAPRAPAPVVAASPTLTLSNNTYTDSATTSQKLIGFDVAVPTGLTATDYCLINKVQGSYRFANGTFAKATVYGTATDVNFPSEQIDSVDADPVYWSDSSARWNYNPTSGGFGATDNPGPPDHSFAAGDVAALKFKIGLYRLADVQTTTTGTITARPIQELPWQFSVTRPARGAIAHPAL